MKIKYFLTLFVFYACQMQAQKLNHAIGLNYSSQLGTYGNSDFISLMYTPQIQKTKGKFIYGITSPMQFGKLMVSSARSEKKDLYILLPLMLEMGVNLNTPCTSFKYLSMFTGVGVSREMMLHNRNYKSDFVNACIGIRIPPMNAPIEIRFNYAKSIQLPNLVTLSAGLSYIFK